MYMVVSLILMFSTAVLLASYLRLLWTFSKYDVYIFVYLTNIILMVKNRVAQMFLM